jgi:hypothetical protein
MATYEEAMTALRNAHEAGDTEAASRLAQIVSGLKNSAQPSPGFWEGAKGTAAAAGDILTGIGKGLVLQPLMATAGKIADPSMSVQDTFEAAGAALDETYPAFGRNMKDNKGYTAPMYPIEKLGEGMQWLAKKGSFGNRDVEGSLNIGLNFAPVPFAKPIGKAVAKGVSAVDPTLRNVKAPSISKTEGLRAEKTAAVVPEDTSVKVDPMADEYTTLMREKLKLESTKTTPETKAQIKALEQRMLDLNKQAVEQRIKENKLQKESAFNEEEVAARAEQERLAGNEKFLEAKQQEMWATDHPGDLAKSGEIAPKEIPPELTKQEEMFGPNFDLEHDGQMPLFKDEPSTALKEQSDLFPPQTNMHRDFTDLRVDDGKGGERPLTRAEFIKTHEALAMEPGTKHVLPKDMEIAFRDYLEQVNGKQGDLFDVGSRTEAWKQETAQKTYEQSIPELLDNHPLVQKAEKRTVTAGGILTKMQMAGEKNASKLARAAKDLEMFMEAEKKTRANVEAELRAATPKKQSGASSQSPLKNRKLTNLGRSGKQRGAIDPEIFKEGYRKLTGALSRLTDQPWVKAKFPADKYMTNSDGTPMVMLHGTTKDIVGSLGGQNEGFHAGFTTSPHMFVTRYDKQTPLVEGHSYTQNKGQRPNGQALYHAVSTKENAQLHPIAITKGNYPFIDTDMGSWNPRSLMMDTRFTDILNKALRGKGYSESMIKSFENYVDNARGSRDRNAKFSEILKKADIDGFFYKNTGESPRSSIHKYDRKKLYQDPTSFVTWDDKNFKSVYDKGEDSQPKKAPSALKSKQGGMLYLGEKQSKALETIKGINPLEKMVPEHTTVADTPEGVVLKAAQASDVADRGLVGKTSALFTKGFLYEKKKTNNPVVKYTYDRISDGIDAVTTKLHTLLQEDLLPKFRALDTPELVELHTAMHDAMMGKYELSASDLVKHGFSEKQIATWESLQRGYDESFNSINTALEKAGHKPITRYTAYMAGMATGDFRTAIVKKVEGKEPVFVGFVGSNVKWMRDQRVKAFLKDNPEYSVGAESFHGKGAVRGDKAATMMEALQMLSEHSPDMDAFAKQLGEHLTGDAYNYMNAKTHTMEKKGVFGMEGSKQWVTGIQSLLPLSAEQRKAVIAKQNALDGFRAQVRYIETMATWSEMSKVTDDLKKVYTDPSIQERQANAIAMSKEYLRNALGDNPSKVGPAIDRVASTIGESIGLGPSILGSAIRGGKQGINTIFFALNPQFLMTNSVQGALMSPLIVNSMRQKGFDVARFDKIGLKETTKAYMDGYKQWQNPNRDAFSTAMWKYGHEHGISSTQIFEHSTDIRKGVAHGYHSVMEFGLGKAEGLPRSGTYAMISNILRDNGYGNHPDIFKVAREITDTVMVDYRRHEGQRINNYFGPAAPLFRNLSAYAGNANSLMASFAREAWQTKDGQVLIAAMLTGLAIHGAMGFPGFAEADKLTEVISAAIGKPTTLTNEVMKAMAQYPKEVGDVIATGFGATLGLDLHNTLGRSSILPSQLGAGGAGKLLTGGEAAFKAVTSPSEMNTKRLVHELSPKLARNWQDLEWFSQGDMAMNKKEGFSTQGAYRRTEEDKTIHKLGATSVNEFKNKEMMRQQTLQDTHLREKQTSIINKLMDKRVSSSGITERDIETSFDRYIEVEGDPRKFVQALKDMEIGVNTTMFERYVINKARGGNISAVKALQRMQEKAQ